MATPCHVAQSDIYEGLELKEGEFRLLKIDVGSDECLSCSLLCYERASAPSYRALSYAWGDHVRDARMRCNGSLIWLSSHLAAGLANFVRHWPGQKIWVDAICINQDSEEEKARQVSIMGGIYAGAKSVVVWLGSPWRDDGPVLERVPAITQCLEKITPPVDISRLGQLGLPAITHPIWRALHDLYDCAWPHRLWIVQEVLLAADLEVLYGREWISWADFVSFAQEAIRSCLDICLTVHRESERHGLILIDEVRIFRDSSPSFTDMTLQLLVLGRKREVSEPVDRLYGIRALLVLQHQEMVGVDYSEQCRRDYRNVYLAFAKKFVHTRYGLDLLSFCSGEETHLGLPSWCPDWNTWPEHSNFHSLHYSSAGVVSDAQELPAVEEVAHKDGLMIEGLELDCVRRAEHLLPWPNFVDSSDEINAEYRQEAVLWVRSLLASHQLAKDTLSSDIVEQVWARTLVAGGVLNLDHRFSLEDFQRTIEVWASEASQLEPALVNEICSDNFGESTLAALTLADMYLFGTFGGRIGLATHPVKMGDILCVLHGGRPIYVLRSIGEHDNEAFTLVCVAYVDGSMHYVNEVPREQRPPSKWFYIE